MSAGVRLTQRPDARERLPITPLSSLFLNKNFSAQALSFASSPIWIRFGFDSGLSSKSRSAYGTMKKYLALVWIVEVPGKNRLEKPSRIGAIPNSSKVELSDSKSRTLSTLPRSVLEKSIHPSGIQSTSYKPPCREMRADLNIQPCSDILFASYGICKLLATYTKKPFKKLL